MVDGFVVPLLYHVGAGRRSCEPARLEHGLLLRQLPGAVRRFNGGLISLATNIPTVGSPEGQASVDAARASALAIIPTDDGRGAVAAGFRRSYFELFVPLIQPGLDVSFTDYQLMGQYRANDAMAVRFFFFGANDNLDQSGQIGDGGFVSAGSRSRASFDMQRLIGTLEIDLNEHESIQPQRDESVATERGSTRRNRGWAS